MSTSSDWNSEKPADPLIPWAIPCDPTELELGESSGILDPWRSRGATERSQRAAEARRTSGRRRGVEPATTDRLYSTAEVEFMNAMQEYKQRSGRMFPTWSEVLEVLCGLGYRKPGTHVPPRGSCSVATA